MTGGPIPVRRQSPPGRLLSKRSRNLLPSVKAKLNYPDLYSATSDLGRSSTHNLSSLVSDLSIPEEEEAESFDETSTLNQSQRIFKVLSLDTAMEDDPYTGKMHTRSRISSKDPPEIVSDPPEVVSGKDLSNLLSTSASMIDSIDKQLNKELETTILLQRNERLLNALAQFDYKTYCTLSAMDVTGICPESKGQVLEGKKDFHVFYQGRDQPVKVSMLSPKVRFLSEWGAVVTYGRLDYVPGKGTKKTMESRIWEKNQRGRWLNCHYHQSEPSV